MARPHPDKVTDAVNAALDEIDHDDTREFRHQAAREILKKDFEAPLGVNSPKPSARALAILEQVRIATQAAVDEHLAAGRPVYGHRKGKPVWIYVSQLERAQQVMDWEGPARP